MSVKLDAAVHLGKECLENLRAAKNEPQRTIGLGKGLLC